MDNDIIIKGGDFYLKKEGLKKVRVDDVNWVVYYIDEQTTEKWIEEYPHAEYHGGGAPQLRLIPHFSWES